MLNPFTNVSGGYFQFFIILIWLLMIVFAVEVIARVGGKMSERTKKIFTIIYVTTGSCMAVFMIYLFCWLWQPETQVREITWPWIIGITLAVVTALFMHRGSKTIK